MKKLIVGNWKMNMISSEVDILVKGLISQYTKNIYEKAELAVCPSFIYIQRVLDILKNEPISVGAQDCSDKDNGAFTGQVSAGMLSDMGCSFVILGHSERRQYNFETNDIVRIKAEKALNNHITPIICVGETEDQRNFGQEKDIVGEQLLESLPKNVNASDIVVAYEPVWAIGTGKTASSDDVADMHGFIRDTLNKIFKDSEKVSILYGGSMKPENAGELLATPNVDGGLIGGASLNADDFIKIGLAA